MEEMRIGDIFTVKFGSNGTQKARLVSGLRKGVHGWYVKAEKYQVKSKKWTKPVKVYQNQIIY